MQPLPAPASEALESATQIGVWTWYVGEDLVTGNTALAKLFGLPRDDVNRGLPLWSFIEQIHPDDRQSVVELIAESLTINGLYSVQYRIAQESEDLFVHAVGRCYVVSDGSGSQIHVGLVINLSSFLADRPSGETAFNALDQIAYHCLVAHKLSKAQGFSSLTRSLQFALEEIGTRIAQTIT